MIDYLILHRSFTLTRTETIFRIDFGVNLWVNPYRLLPFRLCVRSVLSTFGDNPLVNDHIRTLRTLESRFLGFLFLLGWDEEGKTVSWSGGESPFGVVTLESRDRLRLYFC